MKKYFCALLAAAIFLFWAAWAFRPPAPRPAGQNKPATRDAQTPPLMTLSAVALGGFRSLIVDALWMRLITAQAAGQVFEIAQLADWITRLEPEFSAVWAFHAWNMAYNISVLYSNPEHRWQWIRNGIQLLRDNGLQLNPHAPDLYRELGWLYQHKIGQDWDDLHLYYKVALAREMTELFGGPRLALSPAGSEPKKMRDEYKLLPDAMQAIENEYGALDWRRPETHALYWAWRGRRAAAPGQDPAACDQMIAQALAAAFRQGRLFFDPAGAAYIATPQIALLPGALKAYADARQREPADNLKAAYINFLAEAVFILHAYGRDPAAKKIFDKMAAEGALADRNFENFIRRYDRIEITALPAADAIALIEGLLYQGYAAAGGPAAREPPAGRQKALFLWKKYAQSDKNRLQDFPAFNLIEQQAKQRALEESNP